MLSDPPLAPLTPTADTRPEDRVPVGVKTAFGAGNMVCIFTNNLTEVMLTPVYVVSLGLSPALIGLALVIFRFYDAFVDPVVGWLSDNTRTRWGRRRPWLLVGTILCALMVPVTWLVGRDWTPLMLTAWLIGTGIVLYTCMSIYSVPYESLGLELTPDYKERTRVSSYRLAISAVSGLLAGWSWTITQLPIFNDPLTGKTDILRGALGVSIVASVLILISGFLPAFFAKERFYKTASHQKKVSLKSNLREAFKSRPFLILVAVAVCAVTGSGLADGIGFFVRLYYVCGGDQALAAKLNGWQSTCWMPISIASVFMFQFISSRWSKTHALAVALAFVFASLSSQWWMFRPDLPWLSLVNSFMLAVGITGMWQMLPAMNADVVDADELHSSTRREGGFAATFSWFMKVSGTAGIGLPGLIVGFTGFVVTKGTMQSPGVLTALRLWNVLLPSAFIALGLVALFYYPLSVTRMTQIRRQLEDRRGSL